DPGMGRRTVGDADDGVARGTGREGGAEAEDLVVGMRGDQHQRTLGEVDAGNGPGGEMIAPAGGGDAAGRPDLPEPGAVRDGHGSSSPSQASSRSAWHWRVFT